MRKEIKDDGRRKMGTYRCCCFTDELTNLHVIACIYNRLTWGSNVLAHADNDFVRHRHSLLGAGSGFFSFGQLNAL